MNRDQVNKLLPIIIAFAEGKEIQVRVNGGNWCPRYHSPCLFHDTEEVLEYRIKPEPAVVYYRRYLSVVGGIYCVYTCMKDAPPPQTDSHYFVRWIDVDWQKVGV